MRFKYAVTFENWTTPPLTVRGEVEGGSSGTAANARAFRDGLKQKPKGTRWRSAVTLIEKLDVESDDAAEGDPDDDDPAGDT